MKTMLLAVALGFACCVLSLEVATAQGANRRSQTDHVPASEVFKENEEWIPWETMVLRDMVQNGHGMLFSHNKTYDNVIINLIDSNTDKTVCSYFMKPNAFVVIDGVKDGKYKFMFCSGGKWVVGVDKFKDPLQSATFDKTLDFRTTVTAKETTYVSITMNIESRTNGDSKTSRISSSDFAKY